MNSSNDRHKHYRHFSSPTPDSPLYRGFMEFWKEKLHNDPNAQKESKEKYQKAISIINTQLKNGAGLLVDSEFRFFLSEFNSRNFEFGFGSLPASFNVLEGFFDFRKDLFLFEMYPEEDYMFSSFDFLDFITSEKKSKSIEYLKNSIEDEVIYSYNILNDPKEITFKSNDGMDFIFAGISMIKRQEEVYMFVVAGEKCDLLNEASKLADLDYKAGTGRSYIKPSEHRKQEVVPLLNYDDYRKIFLYLRINLDTKTIDTRYVQKDNGNGFFTITDDYDMLIRALKDEKKYENHIKNLIKEINSYDPIFEVAYNCLYLPEYFDLNEDDIVIEEHLTLLSQEKIKPSFFKKDKITFSSEHFFKTKDVWTLDKNNNIILNSTFTADELKLETSGYWKKIDIGKKGKNKKGDIIHNKTWVDQTLSWYESDSPTVNKTEIKSSSNKVGHIYVLHNPGHPVNLFKIGLTTKTVEERAKQLSGTPSVDKFLIAHSWRVNDCFVAEKRIHQALDKFRVNDKREFFQIDYSEALKIISPIIDELNK